MKSFPMVKTVIVLAIIIPLFGVQSAWSSQKTCDNIVKNRPDRLINDPNTVLNMADVSLSVLGGLSKGKCLGNEFDQDVVTKAIRKEMTRWESEKLPVEKRYEEFRKQLDILIDATKKIASQYSPAPRPLHDLIKNLNKLKKQTATLEGLKGDVLGYGNWAYDIEAYEVKGTDIYIATLFADQMCQQNAVLKQPLNKYPAPCQQGYKVGKEIIRIAKIAENLIANIRGDLTNYLQNLTKVQTQWEQYANEARFQFLPELFVNSIFIGAVEDENNSNFQAPPSQQIIFLHPSAAVEYVNGADNGSSLELAMMMEWLGYNQWKWEDDGKIGFSLGFSLVSSISDRAGTKKIGHGGVLHINNDYSFGVTSHGGDVGVFFSIDMAKWIYDKDQSLKDATDMFGVNKPWFPNPGK
ncbi:MAG: hypothetical protein HQL70_05260 [Magnetococcales bacterium]|nr:hypothetical protein [Magnetococcales bacterium]